MTVRQQFDAELIELGSALIRMGALATQAIEDAMHALEKGDKELANQIIQNDSQIDEMEKDIEQRCLKLILKQQPVAGDLRKISTAIKMITDIERIGDSAADIAELSLHLDGCSFPEVQKQVLAMAQESRGMVESAIDAYVKENLLLAKKTIQRDDVVDNAFLEIRRELSRHLSQNEQQMDEVIDYLMIIKYLERQGDHAVNICQWVQFYMTGIYRDERII